MPAGITNLTICNSALIKCGSDTINSLSDQVKGALLCSNMYDICRRQCLRMMMPGFAKKRAHLSLLASTPVWEFANQFSLPNDFLLMIETGGEVDDITYRVENGLVLTNEGALDMIYIYDCQDTSLFDDIFAEAVAFNIARNIVYPLTQKEGLVPILEKGFQDTLRESEFTSSKEGTPEVMITHDWINSRA